MRSRSLLENLTVEDVFIAIFKVLEDDIKISLANGQFSLPNAGHNFRLWLGL
jgi:hypothetical protein